MFPGTPTKVLNKEEYLDMPEWDSYATPNNNKHATPVSPRLEMLRNEHFKLVSYFVSIYRDISREEAIVLQAAIQYLEIQIKEEVLSLI